MSSDRELLARWREQNDRAAGEELFDRHNKVVVRYLLYHVWEKDDVESLVHDTFMTCKTATTQFQGEDAAFRPYLLGVAYNKFREYLRGKKHGSRLFDAHVDSETVAEVTAEDLDLKDPSAFVEQNEERKLLLKAMRRIPIDYQLPLHLSFWEELTNPQIGKALGLPVGTVASRLRLGKERLLTKINEFMADAALVESTRRTLLKWHEDISAQAKALIERIEQSKPPKPKN